MTKLSLIAFILVTSVLPRPVFAQTEKQLISEFEKIDRDAVWWPTQIEEHRGNLLRFGNVIAINKNQIESINLVDNEVILTLGSKQAIVITAKTHFVTTKGIYYDLVELLDKDEREVTQTSEEQRSIIETNLDAYHNLPDADTNSHELQGIQGLYGRTLPWTILSRYCKVEWK